MALRGPANRPSCLPEHAYSACRLSAQTLASTHDQTRAHMHRPTHKRIAVIVRLARHWRTLSARSNLSFPGRRDREPGTPADADGGPSVAVRRACRQRAKALVRETQRALRAFALDACVFGRGALRGLGRAIRACVGGTASPSLAPNIQTILSPISHGSGKAVRGGADQEDCGHEPGTTRWWIRLGSRIAGSGHAASLPPRAADSDSQSHGWRGRGRMTRNPAPRGRSDMRGSESAPLETW